MLWTLKQNLSKLIDFYLFYPETWEKTKSYHRRGEEDASLWSPTFSLHFVRWGGWCTQIKATRVEIRGSFLFFPQIWTLAIEKVCPISKEGDVLTEGSALQVPETVMKFLSHYSGPLNCSSFRFSMLVTVELQYIFKRKSAKTLFQDLLQNKYGTWNFFNSVLLPFGVPLVNIIYI